MRNPILTILGVILFSCSIILPIGKLPFIYKYLSADLQLLIDRHWYIVLLVYACAFLISDLRKMISHLCKNKLLYYLLNIPTYLPAIILLSLMATKQEDLNINFLLGAFIWFIAIFSGNLLALIGFILDLPLQIILRIVLYFFQWLERKKF